MLGIISVADVLELDIGGVPAMAMSKMVGRATVFVMVECISGVGDVRQERKSIEPGDDYCVDWTADDDSNRSHHLGSLCFV